MTTESNQAKPKPAKPRPTQKHRDICAILAEADDWWLNFKRSLAGYNTLTKALQSFNGDVPEDELASGLPLFEFSGSIDGRNASRLCMDVKKIKPPEHVPHVLVPMINSYASDMIESIAELEIRVAELSKLLSTGNQPPTA